MEWNSDHRHFTGVVRTWYRNVWYHYCILSTCHSQGFGDGVGLAVGVGDGDERGGKARKGAPGQKCPHLEMLNKLKTGKRGPEKCPRVPGNGPLHTSDSWSGLPTGGHPIHGGTSTKLGVQHHQGNSSTLATTWSSELICLLQWRWSTQGPKSGSPRDSLVTFEVEDLGPSLLIANPLSFLFPRTTLKKNNCLFN